MTKPKFLAALAFAHLILAVEFGALFLGIASGKDLWVLLLGLAMTCPVNYYMYTGLACGYVMLWEVPASKPCTEEEIEEILNKDE